MTTTVPDSVLERVERVKTSLCREGDPATVRAVVDGPCPACGARDVVEVRADIASFSCEECGTTYRV